MINNQREIRTPQETDNILWHSVRTLFQLDLQSSKLRDLARETSATATMPECAERIKEFDL